MARVMGEDTTDDEKIEKTLGLRKGSVGKLGRRGVVENV